MEQKIEKVEDPADYKGGDSMGYNYEVGDIVTLKNHILVEAKSGRYYV